jgi:hypothetical protein
MLLPTSTSSSDSISSAPNAAAAGKPERRRDSGSATAASSFRSSSDDVLLNFYMPRSLTRSFTVGEGPVVWSSCSTASYYPHIESQSFFLKQLNKHNGNHILPIIDLFGKKKDLLPNHAFRFQNY